MGTLDSSRDTIEWVVDVGGIIGGVASLVAVMIAVVGLRESARLRRASILERDRERLNHRLVLLERVGAEVAELANAFEDRNFPVARLHWRQLRVRLQIGHLETELPLTAQLADRAIVLNRFGELAIHTIEQVLPEVVAEMRETANELSEVPDPVA